MECKSILDETNPNCLPYQKLQDGLHLPRMNIISSFDNPVKLMKAQSVLVESNSYPKRAPIFICAIARKNYSEGEKYNRLHFHDLGAANYVSRGF